MFREVAKLATGLPTKPIKIEKFDDSYDKALENFRFDEAMKYIFEKYINSANLLLNQKTPWIKPFEDSERQNVLQDCIEKILRASYHLKPFIPSISEKIDNCFHDTVHSDGGRTFSATQMIDTHAHLTKRLNESFELPTIERVVLAGSTMDDSGENIDPVSVKYPGKLFAAVGGPSPRSSF